MFVGFVKLTTMFELWYSAGYYWIELQLVGVVDSLQRTYWRNIIKPTILLQELFITVIFMKYGRSYCILTMILIFRSDAIFTITCTINLHLRNLLSLLYKANGMKKIKSSRDVEVCYSNMCTTVFRYVCTTRLLKIRKDLYCLFCNTETRFTKLYTRKYQKTSGYACHDCLFWLTSLNSLVESMKIKWIVTCDKFV